MTEKVIKTLWLPAVLFAVLLLCAPALAEKAEDISQKCEFTASDKSKLFRLTDGKTKAAFEGKKKKENWIEVKTPAGKPAAGLYMIWKADTPAVALEVWDAGAGEFKPYATVNGGAMVHEFIKVENLTRFRFRSTDETGVIPITELTVLTEGDLPGWVQAWQPPCTDADILFFVAHPDDELIFFGGGIPWYAGEKKLHVAVAYMTLKEEPRLHELLDGLWTAGVREYPYVLGFFDKLCIKVRTAYKYWGEDAALDAVAKLLDDTHARVVVTQDVNGEYGHGGHMAVADLCLRVIRDGERELKSKPQKLYLHLWKENKITMDWQIPMEWAGGKTALEVGAEAFKCHRSQQGYDVKLRNGKIFKFEVRANSMFDNAKFGLAYTSVGPDEAKNDFLEHVTR